MSAGTARRATALATAWSITPVAARVAGILGGGFAAGAVFLPILFFGATGAPQAVALEGLDIPSVVLDAYFRAEARAQEVAPGCAVRWSIVAGIWRVESNHARTWGEAAAIAPNGDTSPPIVGVALDGSGGVAAVRDTDGGRFDGDAVWDRAVGPAQFIPSSWAIFGRDGNGDGVASPHNVYDAALATVAHLCLSVRGDYSDPSVLDRALYAYNNSDDYVRQVSRHIAYYDAFRFGGGQVALVGAYALPLPKELLSEAMLAAPHHSYPAWDGAVSEGTAVFAAHGGQVVAVTRDCQDKLSCRCGHGVIVSGVDGYLYTYCHASSVLVSDGATVAAGQHIAVSGNTGHSTGPHLHFAITAPGGAALCPQPLLQSWYEGLPLTPASAPSSGCTF